MIDGAAVRVSLVCFSRIDDDSVSDARLDGQPVDEIYADLTARRGGAGVDLTVVRRLSDNAGVAFMGDTKGGPFDVAGDQARAWLRLPANPNGRTNADVLKPWVNGMDLTRRPAGKWIVDFGLKMSAEDAALYEEPFRWVKEHVWPTWDKQREAERRNQWWLHHRPRPNMWAALGNLSRYIATPTVAKHRLFVWCDVRICPDHQLIVITRDDDVTFGILHSRFHEAWSLRLGTSLEDRPRYTPTTTFETFPFPDGLTPNTPVADYADDPRAAVIADAAQRLVELRDRWLNPPEWVEWLDEPVPGYPHTSGASRRCRRNRAQDAHADEPLQRSARHGSPTRTRSSTLPLPPPTAGRSTSPTTTRLPNCWRSTWQIQTQLAPGMLFAVIDHRCATDAPGRPGMRVASRGCRPRNAGGSRVLPVY